MQPTLLDLPKSVKGDILRLVDYPTRFAARRCCHQMCIDIETLSIRYNEVALLIDFNKIELYLYESTTSCIKMEYHQSDLGCKMVITRCGVEDVRKEKLLPEEHFLEVVARDFKKIIMNPVAKIWKLRINTCQFRQSGNEKFEEDKRNLLENINGILTSLNFKLKVRTFDMYYAGLQSDLLTFLPYLEPKTLKVIFLIGNTIGLSDPPPFELDRTAELDQWKMAKQCAVFQFFMPIPMELWWNFASVSVTIKLFQLADFQKLLEHFIASEVTKYCRVSFYSAQQNKALREYLEKWLQKNKTPSRRNAYRLVHKLPESGVTVVVDGSSFEISK